MRTSIIFVIAMLIITCSHAQTFVNMQDSAYILLNKSRVTTGVLVNRSFPWVNLEQSKMQSHPLINL